MSFAYHQKNRKYYLFADLRPEGRADFAGFAFAFPLRPPCPLRFYLHRRPI